MKKLMTKDELIKFIYGKTLNEMTQEERIKHKRTLGFLNISINS